MPPKPRRSPRSSGASTRTQGPLDVACGTGEHARLLFEVHGLAVDGLDLNPAFVRLARSKLPHAAVFEGDMASFALGSSSPQDAGSISPGRTRSEPPRA